MVGLLVFFMLTLSTLGSGRLTIVLGGSNFSGCGGTSLTQMSRLAVGLAGRWIGYVFHRWRSQARLGSLIRLMSCGLVILSQPSLQGSATETDVGCLDVPWTQMTGIAIIWCGACSFTYSLVTLPDIDHFQFCGSWYGFAIPLGYRSWARLYPPTAFNTWRCIMFARQRHLLSW